MNFYAYRGKKPLGSEVLGTDNRIIINDLKTVRGAIARCNKQWHNNFKLYSFTDIYDNTSFKEII